MNTEQRKAEIRRRLKRSRYPRRDQAAFTDENDHNPTVLEDCAECRGTGRVCEDISGGSVAEAALAECPRCGGAGTTEERVPFFLNNAPAMDVSIGSDGWLTCPCCGKRFTTTDTARWTGRRHKSCGQKINPIRA